MPESRHAVVFFRIAFVLALIFGLQQPGVAQKLDWDGNALETGKSPDFVPLVPGEVENAFPNPGDVRGLAFRDGFLWGINRDATLFQMDKESGLVVSVLGLSGAGDSTSGLAWDSRRERFVVTDALNDEILLVDPFGSLLSSYPSPGIGPLGAAYDPVRDGYWITDWEEGRLYLIDPDTGAERRSLDVSGFASRLSGTGYDSVNDVLVFNDRQNAIVHLISAKDGSPIDEFPLPNPAINNGQGVAVDPGDLTGYVSHFEDETIYEIDLGLEPAECFLVLGPAPGSRSFAPDGYAFATQVKRVIEWYPVTVEEYPVLPIAVLARRVDGWKPATSGGVESQPWSFVAQVVMHNPGVFPKNPEQGSRGVLVSVQADGSVLFRRYGVRDGMDLETAVVPGESGETCIEFPFTVDGMQ